jgi:hypothetical protein
MGFDAAAGSGSGESAGKSAKAWMSDGMERIGSDTRRCAVRWRVKICSEAKFDGMSVDVWRIRRLASRQHRTTPAGTTTEQIEQTAKYLRTAGVSSSKDRAAQRNATQR